MFGSKEGQIVKLLRKVEDELDKSLNSAKQIHIKAGEIKDENIQNLASEVIENVAYAKGVINRIQEIDEKIKKIFEAEFGI